MKQTHIYLVENCYGDKNKVYIGKTTNPNNRKSNHKRTYGSKIIFTVIDTINSVDSKDWKPLESYWIEQFKHWGFETMNVNTGGGGPEYSSEETRLKISQANKGNKNWVGKHHSKETKLKMSQSRLGIKLSKETKLKMSLVSKGHTRNAGKHHSEETKLKISLASKGRTRNAGKIRSEETKAKMRQPKSAETKLNMSLAAKGKPKSEEHKLKMSLAQQQRRALKK